MSSIDKKDEILIRLNNGMAIKIPKSNILQIVMPGISVNRNFHRLSLELTNLDQTVEQIRRKYFSREKR